MGWGYRARGAAERAGGAAYEVGLPGVRNSTRQVSSRPALLGAAAPCCSITGNDRRSWPPQNTFFVHKDYLPHRTHAPGAEELYVET